MESISVSAKARVDLGKKEAKALRKAEHVPCVIYGGEKNIHFSASVNAFRNLVYTPNVYKVEIDVEGTVYTAILKDIQFHPITDRILHIDFLELVEGKAVTMQIPVNISGSARGVMAGGKLRKNMRKLTVRATPENLPSSIDLDVSPLRIGDSIRVRDAETNNFDILNPGSAVIVGVKMARGAAKGDDEEEEETTTEEAATTEA